jgi:hypothetical protein
MAAELSARARDDLRELDERIAELRRVVDDVRSELADTSDKASVIEAAEQQEALIAQLEVRRREIIDGAEA